MKSVTKLVILFISIVGSLLAYMLFHTKETGFCNFYCGDLISQTQNAFLFFYIVLFFCLLTYILPLRIFTAWWHFAKFAIPLVFIASLLINLGILHHSPGAWQDMLDLPLIYLFYSLFTFGSFIQIIRGYYQK